jgi:hypothetical protein
MTTPLGTTHPTQNAIMNYFIVPSDAKIESVEYQGPFPARQGGYSLSLVIEYDYDLSIPSLPVLFVYQSGVWLMSKSEELEPRDKQFCYHVEAQSLASLQDLAEMLLPTPPTTQP